MDIESPSAHTVARTVALARSLRMRGGTLQSDGTPAPVKRDQLRAALASEVEGDGEREPSDQAWRIADDVLRAGERAIGAADRGASHSITTREFASLEAIVRVLGRPAAGYTNNEVQMPRSDLGDNDRWRVLVATARLMIDRVSASVGRLGTSAAYGFVGTGWRIGSDLLVTNRHVARKMVDNPTDPYESWRVPQERWFVQFNETETASPTVPVKVTELAYTAPEDDIDVALLRLDRSASVPAALPLDWSVESLGTVRGTTLSGAEVYVVGHPFRQFASAESIAVFGRADGTKRWSPGVVTSLDAGQFGFEHDCSTLGGNSGSCVLSASGHRVVGLHHGARDVDEDTGAGAANLALALSRLSSHRVGGILKTGQV